LNAFDPAAAKTALAAVAASTHWAAPLVRRFLPDIEAAQAAASIMPVLAQPAPKVRNPADLRRLKREEIDLEALEEYGQDRGRTST